MSINFLSLRELHERLRDRGVEIGYSVLSSLIAQGDIAEQLRAGGNGGRREFLPDTVEVLAAKEAAAVLKISVRMLRASVTPWRRYGKSAAGDRWRRSDLLR